MGYKVVNIQDIDTLDWSVIKGEKETARKSIDGTKIIVKSDSFNDLTHAQALELMNTSEWNNLI